MSRSLCYVLVLVIQLTVIVAQDPLPILNFDCSGLITITLNIDEVCQNMCFGAMCMGFGMTLYHDTTNETIKRRRRRGGGCSPSPNRCVSWNGQTNTFNCDEYPFASTSLSDSVNPTNRCVPKRQNSSQGIQLAQFYASTFRFENIGLDGEFGLFELAFMKSESDACLGTCQSDPNEFDIDGWINFGPTILPPGSPSGGIPGLAVLHRYLLDDGNIIHSTSVFETGRRVHTSYAINGTLHLEQVSALEPDLDAMMANLFLKESSIVEKL